MYSTTVQLAFSFEAKFVSFEVRNLEENRWFTAAVIFSVGCRQLLCEYEAVDLLLVLRVVCKPGHFVKRQVYI